jgi:hypothetical protein
LAQEKLSPDLISFHLYLNLREFHLAFNYQRMFSDQVALQLFYFFFTLVNLFPFLTVSVALPLRLVVVSFPHTIDTLFSPSLLPLVVKR